MVLQRNTDLSLAEQISLENTGDFKALPNDLFNYLCGFCDLKSFLTLSRTCRYLQTFFMQDENFRIMVEAHFTCSTAPLRERETFRQFFLRIYREMFTYAREITGPEWATVMRIQAQESCSTLAQRQIAEHKIKVLTHLCRQSAVRGLEVQLRYLLNQHERQLCDDDFCRKLAVTNELRAKPDYVRARERRILFDRITLTVVLQRGYDLVAELMLPLMRPADIRAVIYSPDEKSSYDNYVQFACVRKNPNLVRLMMNAITQSERISVMTIQTKSEQCALYYSVTILEDEDNDQSQQSLVTFATLIQFISNEERMQYVYHAITMSAATCNLLMTHRDNPEALSCVLTQFGDHHAAAEEISRMIERSRQTKPCSIRYK